MIVVVTLHYGSHECSSPEISASRMSGHDFAQPLAIFELSEYFDSHASEWAYHPQPTEAQDNVVALDTAPVHETQVIHSVVAFGTFVCSPLHP